MVEGIHRRFDEGRAALDAGDTERAISVFEHVTAMAPANGHAWFNLGLAYKLKRDWGNSVRCNRRAAEINPANLEAIWNLGVAATAMEDWEAARWAWRGIGIDPGPGTGPPSLQLGPSPIRLTTGEVVWADRVDPCRARIANVPLPESGHRWGDVVLHDVVPRGERQAWGRSWGVFDELIRMEHGALATLEAELTVPTNEDGLALHQAAADHHIGAEDWMASVRWLCRTCSLGSPHEHNGDEVVPIWQPQRRYGFAGPIGEVERVLAAWADGATGRASGPVREATVRT